MENKELEKEIEKIKERKQNLIKNGKHVGQEEYAYVY